jgi:hypothetical protein
MPPKKSVEVKNDDMVFRVEKLEIQVKLQRLDIEKLKKDIMLNSTVVVNTRGGLV